MATFILKSLGIGYALIVLFLLISGAADGHYSSVMLVVFVGPIFFWPALLIVSGIVALILRAIDERKLKS